MLSEFSAGTGSIGHNRLGQTDRRGKREALRSFGWLVLDEEIAKD
jgi:hypothetical protein